MDRLEQVQKGHEGTRGPELHVETERAVTLQTGKQKAWGSKMERI